MAAANEKIIKDLLDKLNLIAGVDTFTLRADQDLTVNYHGIEHIGVLNACKTHGRLWKYKVTCDKISGGYNKAKFADIIEYVREVFSAAQTLEISRLDIRFDNLTPSSYDNYYKLNALLLSLIANAYNYGNRYASVDPITGEKKSICVQDKQKTRAIEYYNKQIQKPELGIGARLEFRNKKTNIDLLMEFDGAIMEYVADWFDEMTAAADKKILNELKRCINQGIANSYNAGEYITIAEYLACNCLKIYDKQQAGQLFEQLGKSARNGNTFFAKRQGQQIITLDDLREYIQILRTAAEDFLLNG